MRSEGKHTVSICVGTGSFLDSPANPGKAERDRTGKPAQHERYLVCYHNECKRTYMTEKVLTYSNSENGSDSSFFTVARSMACSVQIKSVNSTQQNELLLYGAYNQSMLLTAAGGHEDK